jgi:hypothetical protein
MAEEHHKSFLREITSGAIEGGSKAKVWLILGGIALVLYLVWRAKQGQAAQNYSLPYAASSQGSASSDTISQQLGQVLSALQSHDVALSGIAANQQTLAGFGAAAEGMQTWLSCCDPLSWNCEASCIKQRGGTTAGIAGSGNVSNVKTQNRQTFAQAATPFMGCQSGSGWNWACVGSVLEGNPTLQSISVANPSTISNAPITRTATARRVVPA